MSDRKVTLDVSKDGGHNFNIRREGSLGELGEYSHSVRFTRFGVGRRFVGRIRVTSPIKADYMGGFATFEVGDR